MFKTNIQIRVRYADTDQMKMVYYGKYAEYLEVARTEALREIGISYKSLEDSGILLPVYEYSIKFLKPAKYDDLLKIETIIPIKPSVKLVFNYIIFNQLEEKLSEATTTLVFLNSSNNKPTRLPEYLDKLSEFYYK